MSNAGYRRSENVPAVREAVRGMGWTKEDLDELRALFSHYVPPEHLATLMKRPGYEEALYVILGEKLERFYNQGQNSGGLWYVDPDTDVDEFIQIMLYGHAEGDRWIPGLMVGLKPFEVSEKTGESIGLLGHKSGYNPSQGGTVPTKCPDCGDSKPVLYCERSGNSEPVLYCEKCGNHWSSTT